MAFAFNDDRSKYDLSDILQDAFDLSKATGTLAESHGGTGQTSLRDTRAAMGLGATTGALPIANGGTGATTAAAARKALGLGNTAGALPIANGGTGATTAAAARTALGAASTAVATTSANGLMSSSDKYHLNALYGTIQSGYIDVPFAGYGYQNATNVYWLYFPLPARGSKVEISGTASIDVTGNGSHTTLSVAAKNITARLVNGDSVLELSFTGSSAFAGGTRQPLFAWLTGLEVQTGDNIK